MTKSTSKTPAGKSGAKKGTKAGKKSGNSGKAKTVPATTVEAVSTTAEEKTAESVVVPTSEEISAEATAESQASETTTEQAAESTTDDNQEPVGSENENQGQETNQTEKVARIAVVIPYLKSKAQGLELLYAIRSIAKNFCEENIQLVVIGDREEWFGDEILFIEHNCIGANPQADVLDKLKTIIANECVCEDFIWSNDDIYFVAPTSLEDIRIPKIVGTLQKEPYNTSQYNANKGKTIDLLLSRELPIRNFSTHLPFSFSKDKMIDVFEAFPEMHTEGLLLASMYFNYHISPEVNPVLLDWSSDEWMLRVVSGLETEAKKEKFRTLIGTKHFLNHSEAGFSKLLMNWLERQFPEKSRFEK